MKKVLSLVLVLTLVLGSFSFAFAAPNDVVGTEYEDAVERLGQLGIFTGYPDGTFKPNNTITRSEFAAVVVRAKGLEPAALAAKGTTAFADVPAENWASGYVNIASKMGFVKGYPNGNFGLNDPITYEQAVTLVVRVLGYEQAAEARGGYPYGYLIVANENGLLDAVKGTQGLPAPRGLVAQLVDNALEIPMMIQVGYGAQTKWVVSGTEDTEERLLLDDLGFEKIVGRMTEKVNDDNEITLTDKNDKDHVLVVAEDFDSEANFGLKLTAWVNGKDEVAVYTVNETPIYDAVEYDADDNVLTVVAAEDDYDMADDVVVYANGSLVKKLSDIKASYDYAKVVVVDKKVVFVDAYELKGYFVVSEVDGNVAYDFNDDEVNLKDYTIVKEGKTIAVADLEEGDNLFFNKTAKYAEVYNDSVTGKVDKAYDDSFKLDGTTYGWADYALYLEDEELAELTHEVIASMMDEEGTVELFFNRVGDVVLVAGDTGAADTSNYYGLVTAKAEKFEIRNKDYFNLDVLNKEEKVVKYDVLLKDGDKLPTIEAGEVVIVTVDEDGEYDSYSAFSATKKVTTDAKLTDKYVGSYRLQDSALVFWAEEDTDGNSNYAKAEVMTWAEAADEFSEVTGATFYANSANKVVAVVVTKSNADTDPLTHTGLVTSVRKFSSSTDKWEITIQVDGEAKVLVTDTSKVKAVGEIKGTFVTLTVGNTTGLVTKIEDAAIKSGKIDTLSTSGKTITVAGDVYRLVDGFVVYNEKNKEIALRDLNDGDTVTLALDEADTIFVKYVKRTAVASADGGSGEETEKATFELAFNARGNVWVTIDGTDYLYGGAKTATELNEAYKGKEVEFVTKTVDSETVVVSIELAE
ncbi:S-layer homology domain-containing protein [Proteiniborus sp.]|uniref:S-layer homology domain-containing protein n=1 Tax=Proteiniborus sp. TaxID=2079015 RepID=UPI003331C7E5